MRILAAFILLLILGTPADAGVIKSSNGVTAQVADAVTGALQCVVNALERVGYPIKFMGGFASRGHIRGSLHYSGHAVDINQVDRGVTTPKMPSNEVELASGCGVTSGAIWRNNDSGHFELRGGSAPVRYAHRTTHRHRHLATAVRGLHRDSNVSRTIWFGFNPPAPAKPKVGALRVTKREPAVMGLQLH
jgi:hypothetical protein